MKVLKDSVIDEQDAADMTDEQIIEVCLEDVLDCVLDGATWKIERGIK